MSTKHRIFVGKDVHKFSSAHMTIFPDGSKERIHGHNFQVTVAFDLVDLTMSGFLDFALVKNALAEQCKAWQERLLLAERSPHYRFVSDHGGSFEFTLCGKRYVVPTDEVALLPLENVVVETLAMEFARQFIPRLGQTISPANVTGIEVTVSEAAGQGGTYYWTWS